MSTPPSPTPTLPINLCDIFSESKRINSVHSRHFLALCVIFLLPLSFSFSVYPALYQLLSQSSTTPTTKTLIFTLFNILFIFVFAIFATGSITHSVFNGFHGRPVKLVPAIKSAFTSFFRLLSTSFVILLVISGLLSVLGLALFLSVKATQLLGFQDNFTSLCLVFSIIFTCVLFYSQVNWVFAYVVVVVESSWGLEPLKRSKFLIKGMKWVAFSMILFYGFFSGILVCIAVVWNRAAGADKWKSSDFVMHIVITSALLTMIMFSNLSATTVFYMYSKALHGEVAEEFAREYISLPFDDEKVPHVVYVA